MVAVLFVVAWLVVIIAVMLKVGSCLSFMFVIDIIMAEVDAEDKKVNDQLLTLK